MRKTKSSILEAVHETAKGLNKAGVMSQVTLREFDQLCLLPIQPLETTVKHRRAAAWFARHGQMVDAIRHTQAAGDWPAAARLLADHAFSLTLDGQARTIEVLVRAFADNRFDTLVFLKDDRTRVPAAILAVIARAYRPRVNLIPYNWIGPGVSGREYRQPAAARMDRFLEILRGRGIVAHFRRTRGEDIDGACGQLRETERVGEKMTR